MMWLTKNLGLTAALGLAFLAAGEARAGTIFFQGFEANNNGWNVFGGAYDATRVASGTNGVTSEAGSYHAQVTGGATNWGGYSSVFPAGGYTTSLGIYLNLNQTTKDDTRFDFSSSINKSDGKFLRDFVFNAGFYNNSIPPEFIISASNNAGRGNSYPKNPGRDPFAITQSGWYDFQQRFYDNAGVLAVDLSIIDHASGTLLHKWTLSNPGDLISGVGGNRYGWFASNEFQYLAIDNTSLTTPTIAPEPTSLAVFGLVTLAAGAYGWRRRKQSVTA